MKNRVQVLISTMNQTDYSFLESMNIQTDAIIGNQNGTQQQIDLRTIGHSMKVFCSTEKGLAKNRNLTLNHSDGEICLLADDDLCYLDGYEQTVVHAFQRHPKADIIIFNLFEDPIKRYVIKRPMRVHQFNYTRYGAVRIAFKRRSILENGIEFDNRFGAGGEIPLGEDTIFLRDCLKKKLKVYAVPDFILRLQNNRESTWFKGYDGNYFINKGSMYNRLSKNWWSILCFQDVIRHRKEYDSFGPWWKVFSAMCLGAKKLKKY